MKEGFNPEVKLICDGMCGDIFKDFLRQARGARDKGDVRKVGQMLRSADKQLDHDDKEHRQFGDCGQKLYKVKPGRLKRLGERWKERAQEVAKRKK